MLKYEDAYNELCKKILSYKVLLAQILKSLLKEFWGYESDEIVKCIEDGSSTPRVKGSTNDLDEVRFDLLFSASIPGQNKELLINIEAQRTTKLKYEILDRAITYKGHLISYQSGRYIKNQEFGELHKVVTIWICFDAPTKAEEGSITYFPLSKHLEIGYNSYEEDAYDKELIVLIYLGQEKSDNKLLSFLEVLFTNELTVNEKKKVLLEEYGINVDNEMKGDLDSMCNLAEGIREKGRLEGRLEERRLKEEERRNIILRMFQKGYVIEEIADIVCLSMSEVQAIVLQS